MTNGINIDFSKYQVSTIWVSFIRAGAVFKELIAPVCQLSLNNA
jgi:hypothetical protein